jgi:hypothetical protein
MDRIIDPHGANGRRISTVDNIALEENGSREEQIEFSFPTTGDNQRVDILKAGTNCAFAQLVPSD